MNKKIIAVIVMSLIAVLVVALLLVTSQSDSSPTEVKQQTAEKNQVFTAEEVANHNNENDCWTIIDNSVYDITSYIPRHQGGDEILRACGVDASTLFDNRETEDGEEIGSGTPHSSDAASQLERLKIGELDD